VLHTAWQSAIFHQESWRTFTTYTKQLARSLNRHVPASPPFAPNGSRIGGTFSNSASARPTHCAVHVTSFVPRLQKPRRCPYRLRHKLHCCPTCGLNGATAEYTGDCENVPSAPVKIHVHVMACMYILRHSCWLPVAGTARQTRDIVTLIIDGMDRKKYLLPRWKWGRTPKDAKNYTVPA
jgi:hypothetical protein